VAVYEYVTDILCMVVMAVNSRTNPRSVQERRRDLPVPAAAGYSIRDLLPRSFQTRHPSPRQPTPLATRRIRRRNSVHRQCHVPDKAWQEIADIPGSALSLEGWTAAGRDGPNRTLSCSQDHGQCLSNKHRLPVVRPQPNRVRAITYFLGSLG